MESGQLTICHMWHADNKNELSWIMHKPLKLLMLVIFMMSQTVSFIGQAVAQFDEDLRQIQDEFEFDVEPPLIEHDIIQQAEADIRQTFVASVVDDQELDSVVFYYRFVGETSYSRYVMMRVSFSSSYVAQIPTNPNDLSPIEYYIEARDTSGNRTVRGYTFSPLVRQLVPGVSDEPGGALPTGADGSAGAQGDQSHSGAKVHKAVYVVAGVLLLGLLASAADSSGGSTQSPVDGDCTAAGCRLTLTVNRPTQ